MTSNLGYERGTMASQPSLYNEERKLLRIRAWEQRNQETSQDQKLNPESLPLFGKPYKTNKWDELSCRIQKMLGSYEDADPLASLAPLTSQSDPVQATCTDLSTKPAFHAQCGSADSQKGAFDGSSDSSLCMRNPLYPNRHKLSSPYTKASLHHRHGGSDELSSASHQKSDSCPDDMASLISFTQAHAALSPVAEPLPPRHCSDAGIAEPLDASQKDPFESRQRRGSLGGSPCSVAAGFTYKQSPAWEGGPLLSQSFPPPLAPKAPNIAMTQKPTAYVRPMDGQDQVVNESPELKPSPQPYAPLPDLIGSKSTPEKVKMLPPFLETRSNEAQCVEDILREMTHSWPPPLTAIHTPSTADPPKSPLHPKEVTHIPSLHPDQKNYSSPATAPSSVSQQDVPLRLEAAHSSGVESASSSDSESSSESENESCTEDVLQLPRGGATESKTDVPVVSHGDWQLGNWIRSSQQSSSAEGPGDGSASQSTPLKKLVPSSKTPASPRAPTPRLSPLKEESRGQQRGGRPPSGSRKTTTTTSSGSKHVSKSVKRPGPACPQAGVRAEPAAAVVGAQDTEPSFTCRPKVKRKPERGDGSKTDGSKTDVKKPAKGSSGEKLKSKSRVVPAAPCPTCGQKSSSQCSCLAQNPAPLDRLAPPPAPPPLVKSSSKVKTEMLSEKSLSKPHKGSCPADQQQVSSGKIPGAPPRSLLVKISLDLLVHVPQGSGAHQQGSSKRKRGPKVEEGCTPSAPVKSTKKRPAELDGKGQPKKKHRVQNEPKVSHRPSPALTTVKPESSGMEERRQKKSKKQPPTPQGTKKRHKHSETRVNGKSSTSVSGATVRHKKTTEKSTERSKAAKVSTKSSSAPPVPAKPTREVLTSRPLLVFEDRKHPVKHYIKEAKKLKHKADAETDKVRKAFDYLNAAMSFVESGITMETDPHSPKSSYAMYGDTVELIKFVLKLKSAADSPLSPSENDFVVLCMRCQSLLQMAIFNYKHKTAVKYSKTLTEHFKNSKPPQEPSFCNTDSLSPMCDMPSPASSSGPSSNNSGACGSGGPLCSTVAIPKLIHQVALSYVNITAMFLNAHDIWEQAEELAHTGSGMLSELDVAMGPLSLMSSMNSVVRYTRQGLHWLRLAG